MNINLHYLAAEARDNQNAKICYVLDRIYVAAPIELINERKEILIGPFLSERDAIAALPVLCNVAHKYDTGESLEIISHNIMLLANKHQLSEEQKAALVEDFARWISYRLPLS